MQNEKLNNNGLSVYVYSERVNRYIYDNVYILTVLQGRVILWT